MIDAPRHYPVPARLAAPISVTARHCGRSASGGPLPVRDFAVTRELEVWPDGRTRLWALNYSQRLVGGGYAESPHIVATDSIEGMPVPRVWCLEHGTGCDCTPEVWCAEHGVGCTFGCIR